MAPGIRMLERGTIYANPVPHLVSRQAVFPGLVALDADRLLAMFSIGQAFDAADMRAVACTSIDRGRTWSDPEPLWSRESGAPLESETFKPVRLHDGTLVATGYVFERPDALTPIVDPETNTVLPMVNKVSTSHDEGRTWTPPAAFSVAGKPLELSGPAIQLTSGRIVAAAAPFHLGAEGHEGWIIASDDGGARWLRLSTFFRSDGGTIAPWECRVCEIAPDTVAVLFWAYDAARGHNLENHLALSRDGGETFAPAIATGITGQASNLAALGPDRLLTIHCHREAPVSLTVRVLGLGEAGVTVEGELPVFSADAMASRTDTIANQFASLKFGQPGLLALSKTEVLATWWQVENCQHVIKCCRLVLDG